MTIKDLKVGMKVYIRDDLQLGKFYGNCKYHTEMVEFIGVQIVSEIKEDIIKLNGAPWNFTLEMIDWKLTEKLNKKDTELVYDGSVFKEQIYEQEIRFIRGLEEANLFEDYILITLIKSLIYIDKDEKGLKNKIKKVWKPKYFEMYYFVDSRGRVERIRYLCDDIDKNLLKFVNCFKTKEEAEKRAIEVRKIFNK